VILPHPRTGVLFGSLVPPGSGWPGDPANASTPVAGTPSQVVALAQAVGDLDALDAQISVCRACPRLVDWREEVAMVKRRAFSDQPYWGRPAMGGFRRSPAFWCWGWRRPRMEPIGPAEYSPATGPGISYSPHCTAAVW